MLKILHTADWHVGRSIRGRSRMREYAALLDDLVGIAAGEKVDLVLVAGDLFDSSAPNADAERLVYQTLLRLADTGATVCAIAGNHDNPRRLRSVRDLFQRIGPIHLQDRLRIPEEGGTCTVQGRSGDTVEVCLVPFLSQHRIFRAYDLMRLEASRQRETYAQAFASIVEAFANRPVTTDFRVLAAHVTVEGSVPAGGERAVHTSPDYHVDRALVTDGAFDYVALGHLHRTQPVCESGCWYSGSLVQLDFADRDPQKVALLATLSRTAPCRVEPIALQGGRRLRVVRGSLATLQTLDPASQDYLRIDLQENRRPGLAEEVRELFPNAVDIRLAERDPVAKPSRELDLSVSPARLFEEYLQEQKIDSRPLMELFASLLEEEYETETA